MKIYKLELSKKDLQHIPEKERSILFQIGIMLNEINILNKLTLLSYRDKLTEVERKGQITQKFFIIGMLVGKLWECWETLRKAFFNKEVSEVYKDLISDDGNKNLENLKKYFKEDHWIRNVRNKFSLHYDHNEISKKIKSFLDNETLEIYLSDIQGNSLYYSSFLLQLKGILSTINPTNEHEALKSYLSKASKIAGEFIEFFNHFLVALTEKYLNLKPIEMDIPDPPPIEDLFIPYFLPENRQQEKI